MQRITKREQANRAYFRQRIVQFLESLGARRSERTSYLYNLLTRLGMLGIEPYETWVACRWEDVAQALQEIGPHRMNPFSGKWNHLYDHAVFRRRAATQLAVEDFCAAVGRYLRADSNGSATATMPAGTQGNLLTQRTAHD